MTVGSSRVGAGAPCSSQSFKSRGFGRAGFQSFAAAMGHPQGRLEQEQALLGGERGDPPPLGAFDDRGVVGLRLEPEEREPNPLCHAATRGRPLDCSRAWSKPAESRFRKADLAGRVRSVDLHPGFARSGGSHPHHDLGFAVRHRVKESKWVYRGDLRIHHLEPGAWGQVKVRAVGEAAEHDQTLSGLGAMEHGLGGQDLKCGGITRTERRR